MRRFPYLVRFCAANLKLLVVTEHSNDVVLTKCRSVVFSELVILTLFEMNAEGEIRKMINAGK